MPNLDDAPREVVSTVKQNTIAPRKTHPMLLVAAGAVTIFSAVGVAMMTGILPSAHSVSGTNGSVNSESKQNASVPITTAAAGAAAAGVGTMMEAPEVLPTVPPTALPTTAAQTPSLQPLDSKTVGQPLAKTDQNIAAHKAPVVRKPTVVASAAPYSSPGSANERGSSQASSSNNGQPVPVYAQNGSQNNDPRDVVVRPDRAPPPVAVICRSCGIVDSIIPVEKAGQGSGAGAILGGVLGGVLGHQVGNGRGRDAATVAGAVGGAVLGNQVERNNNNSRSYDVRVRMDDNTFSTVRYEVEPNVRVGDKVRVEGGRLVRG